ncbi:DISARM system phospholipase D-like protein DrmC [Actinomadura sp. SCN-SB]|uniref:DISARM system phospholipase D-like protein DrmC n=1 Tax=Actinomadura sp. SCN-SB TaxID=3373092 RepID=UPI003751FC91
MSSTPLERFQRAAAAPAAVLGPARLRRLAQRFENGAYVSYGDIEQDFRAEVDAIRDAAFQEDDLPLVAVAAYLNGAATALEHQESAVHVEPVWSGPTSHAVPVRSTAQALTGVVERAGRELLLMTYSAVSYPPLQAALGAAVGRGVRVHIVVETFQGAGAICGEEPAAAFRELGFEPWHWPATRRPDRRGLMHARIVVADRQELLVSSADLTQPGVENNIAAGLLVRGGPAPERAAEHFDALCADGTLERM